MQAVDIHAERRIVEILRHEYVGDRPRQVQLASDILSDVIVGVEVCPDNLHVVGAGAPMLTTASTKLPVEKNGVNSGISSAIRFLIRRMYSVAAEAMIGF